MYQAALVLEGGALRGQYTAGVLDTFLAENIAFKLVVGVSAGALCGANFISRQFGRTNQVNVNYRDAREYISPLNVFRYDGIINLDFLFADHGDGWINFDEDAYEASPMDFAVVATSIETGQAVYFEKPLGQDLYDDLKASASMPFVAQPAPTVKGPCMDGGTADPVPFSYAANRGFDKIVVVRTRDRAYRAKDITLLQEKASNQLYSQYPEFIQTMVNHSLIYNHQLDWLDELEQNGRAFVVAPDEPITIDRLERDKKKLTALYHQGRADGLKILDNLLEYLNR
ncbi:patatin-like phospholipase family protein [Xylocopilactobacillus apicola]|uniref:Patatin family protein n=1 Tax=Xylocopilactobacillus apicola TaxID=2932184 RepID=A0AAU9D4N7_9LACO|nr:patatin family protein [Xylocopilactobacillus apicola]BDR58734.1 patatin family protein [Xylocopilactobacillus apicola]